MDCYCEEALGADGCAAVVELAASLVTLPPSLLYCRFAAFFSLAFARLFAFLFYPGNVGKSSGLSRPPPRAWPRHCDAISAVPPAEASMAGKSSSPNGRRSSLNGGSWEANYVAEFSRERWALVFEAMLPFELLLGAEVVGPPPRERPRLLACWN